MKRLLFVVSLALAASITIGGPSAGLRAAQRPAPEKVYDVVQVEKDLMIPMRDGIKIATDIYRPFIKDEAEPAKLPILLSRTPYDKTAANAVEQAKWFAKHGYIVVLQDDRGAYKSEGVQSKYIGYVNDGYDAVEALARLPYSNGEIGMWGTSYSAHTAAGATILHPPHLKTVVLNCGGIYNGWTYKMRNHGAFELAQQTSWVFGQMAAQNKNAAAKAAATSEKMVDWVGSLNAKKGLTPLATAPNFEDYFYEMMTAADYGEYWKVPDRNWSLYFDQTLDIPMMHVTGWYDSYGSGSISNYVGLSKIKKSPIRLLVGPWLHGGNTRSAAGEVEFGATAAMTDFNNEFHLRWFDHFLKGQANGVERDPAVKVFVMGTGDGHKDQNGRMFHGGYWKTATAWPLPEAKDTDYYLHADGTLSPNKPAAQAPPSTYTYDPRHPVPTIGGSFSGSRGIAIAGAFDQREREFTGDASKGFFGSAPPYLPLKARQDVLVFQTEPLAADTEVVGPIIVKLFAASTAPDTDFTAKLVDVYPPSKDYPTGFEMNLTDGIIRARYRNSPEKPEMMKAGEVYKFEIEPFPTANVFKKGHRIRVDISSSNFPRFDVNPNTGEPIGMNRREQTADNSVYHDAAHLSSIVLPIVGRPAPATQAAGR